ncbi:unnamed protein product [Somion occarium]|uniref:Conserved oligomeric Golgi complex subunit 1 n=2 Tax=Somion occarium TaxID=3059160 RepID=A0ABP1CH46_9APHY
MARRPSVVSLSSVNSSGSLPKLGQLPSLSQSFSQSSRASANSSRWLSSRTASGNGKVGTNIQQDEHAANPDELFVKHTVAEVKGIQQKLRHDADAKQQELRVMVGERYRDLLQASTSIIALARSSDNVLHALEDMRSITSAVGTTAALPRIAPSVGQEDAHLQVLQALSAHMKLLLDTPEHLWRLMERKLYLHAAWLFLLCRVVHRALLRDDADDDTGWNVYGLNIAEQFPLVQRQWDVVSQFRTQITHKATLSLRENTPSPAAVGASLLSLHLIESRPLPETLTILLMQRTRALTPLLTRPRDNVPNGTAGPSRTPRVRKAIVRNTRSKAEAALDVVAHTLGAARQLFIGTSERPPLLMEALDYIQTDPAPPTSELPMELKLTTQLLLTSLPSSSHFMLLPPNIKSYRPYIDSNVASSLSKEPLNDKLQEWFIKATEDIKLSMGKWLSELHSVTEVWKLRTGLFRWMSTADGLETGETAVLMNLSDEACLHQAATIWRDVLESANTEFRAHLSSALTALKNTESNSLFDASPVQYLFQAPSLTPSSQIGFKSSLTDEAFERYRSALKQRISFRTPLLDDVLATVERSAETLRNDLKIVVDDEANHGHLSSKMLEMFRSDVAAFCDDITNALEQTAQCCSGHTALESHARELLFISRAALELGSEPRFAHSLGCEAQIISELQIKLRALHEQLIAHWRRDTVADVVREHWHKTSSAPHGKIVQEHIDSSHPRPSSALLAALLSLSKSVQQIGTPLDPSQRARNGKMLLVDFVSATLDTLPSLQPQDSRRYLQLFWDMTFLRSMLTLWSGNKLEVGDRLHATIADVRQKLPTEAASDKVEHTMSELLSRLQIALSALLPPVPPSHQVVTAPAKGSTPSSILRPGSGAIESQYQPAVDLVKPPPRFGLLLVGSSASR